MNQATVTAIAPVHPKKNPVRTPQFGAPLSMIGVTKENCIKSEKERQRKVYGDDRTYHDGKEIWNGQTPSGRFSSEVLFGDLREVCVTNSTTGCGRECRHAGKENQKTSKLWTSCDIEHSRGTHSEISRNGDHVAVNSQRTSAPLVDKNHGEAHREELYT